MAYLVHHHSVRSLWNVLFLSTAMLGFFGTSAARGSHLSLETSKSLPSVAVLDRPGKHVFLDTSKGTVTGTSIVPRLYAPFCDEQTHRFSEDTEGLDRMMSSLTLCTLSSADQPRFASQAQIDPLTYSPDAPAYHFGSAIGLVFEEVTILHQAVFMVDTDGLLRYVELVPFGQLPDFEQVCRVARTLLSHPTPGDLP